MYAYVQQEFYKDANAALVVYDLTRLRDTLPNAIKWKERIDSFVGESIPMILLGNKVCVYACIHICVCACVHVHAVCICMFLSVNE